MATDIVQATVCQAPLDVAFDYVADYRNVPDWLVGVTEFTPVGEQDHGLGSVFDASMHLGMKLSSRIRVHEWVDNRLIGFESVKGFSVRSRWNFEASGPRETTVTAQITYGLPFGPAGKAMGRVIAPVIRQAVVRSSDQLRSAIEAVAA